MKWYQPGSHHTFFTCLFGTRDKVFFLYLTFVLLVLLKLQSIELTLEDKLVFNRSGLVQREQAYNYFTDRFSIRPKKPLTEHPAAEMQYRTLNDSKS